MKKVLDVYKDRKVIITGHTGFKGSWLSIWLNYLGAEVVGISLEPRTKFDNFLLSGIKNKIIDYRADIRNINEIQNIFAKEKAEILFHLAAQPIVLESYQNPVYTYETNILGTVNVLESFRNSESLNIGVFISSDKCYDNKEWVWGYRENDSLGGFDPYSSSKGASELIINSYRNSFFKNNNKYIASVRAGNVIGGGDWTPNRIVVDCIKSIEQNIPIQIRNPLAIRPWQHVLEPLGGYLLLGAKMMLEKGKYCEAWNFGPEQTDVKSVAYLIDRIIKHYGKGNVIEKTEQQNFHEAQMLALEISKAKIMLGWKPMLDFEKAIEFTVEWYKKYQTENVHQLCINQIKQYTSRWK